MKSYTDIEQSRKLAEILPLESADMCYRLYRKEDGILDYQVSLCPYQFASWIGGPCWSLTALLNVLPVSVNEGQHCLALINSNPNGDIEWLCCYEDDNGNLMMECYADNQVDACVEMIYKLKERNLL